MTPQTRVSVFCRLAVAVDTCPLQQTARPTRAKSAAHFNCGSSLIYRRSKPSHLRFDFPLSSVAEDLTTNNLSLASPEARTTVPAGRSDSVFARVDGSAKPLPEITDAMTPFAPSLKGRKAVSDSTELGEYRATKGPFCKRKGKYSEQKCTKVTFKFHKPSTCCTTI